MELLPQYPLNKNSVSGYYLDPWYTTNGYSPHYAIDFKSVDYKGEDIFASTKGKVIVNGYFSDAGNMVIIANYLTDKTIITRYMHLKELSKLKIGDVVNQGDLIGQMGSTGLSTGVHLHFEFWVCPKGYAYKYADKSKYSKDPVSYCYIYPHQLAINSLEYKLNNYSLKIVGKVEPRNENIDQLEVKVVDLNCRIEPSLSRTKLGYILPGIYNILDVEEKDGYKWYLVGDNMWIAFNDNWINLLPKKEVIKPDEIGKDELDKEEIDNNKGNEGNEEKDIVDLDTKKKNLLHEIFTHFVNFIKSFFKKS